MDSILLVFDEFEPAKNFFPELVTQVIKELDISKIIFFHFSEKKEDPIFSNYEKLMLLSSALESKSNFKYIIDGDSFEKSFTLYKKILQQKERYPNSNLFLLLNSKQFKELREKNDFLLIQEISKIIFYLFPEDLDLMEERFMTLNRNEMIFLETKKELNELFDTSIYHPKKEGYTQLIIEYMNKSSECAIKRIKKELSEDRFKHSLRVAGMVKFILGFLESENHEYSYNAYLAALYHDISKEVEIKEQIRIAHDICKIKRYPSPKVLHGYVGAWFLKERFFFENEEILNAIKEHTIPSANPSLITKILYIADHMEPMKKKEYSEEVYDSWWKLVEEKKINQVFQSIRMWSQERHHENKILFYD